MKTHNWLMIFLLSLVVACSSAGAPPPTTTPENAAAPAVTPSPTTPPTPTRALTLPTVRERIALRDLPGAGRAPYGVAVLGDKTYVINNASDNLAIIQNDRVVKFVATGKEPIAIASDPAQKRLYVANRGDKTISLLVNDQVTLTTSIGEDPATVLFIENRLWVGLSSKGIVRVLDPATLQTQASIPIPNTFGVINLAGDATHHRIYAGVFDKIAVLDSTNLRVLTTLAAKGSYFTLLSSPANDSILTALYDSTTRADFLTALDPISGATRARVQIGGDPRGAALTADGARAYIANTFSNSVSVINVRDLTQVAEIPVDSKPYALALDENARRLYVANSGSDNVSAIDTQSNQVVGTIPVGMNLTALGANETTGRVYVASASTDSVFVLDGTRVVKEIGVGHNPADLARDARTNRVLIANAADHTLSILDESNLSVRTTQPITQYLTTVATDGARVFAGDQVLDANALAPIGRLTMRGITIGSVMTPDFVRVNPNINRIYAMGGNGVPGSNGRRVTYSIDGATLQQRTTLAYSGNSEHLAIDPDTNRLFIAGMHPLAYTYELSAFDANDTKIFTLTLSAHVTGMVYNPQTHHLFLAQETAYARSGAPTPTPADNTILVLDTNSFGQVAQLKAGAPGKMARFGNLIYVANREDGSVTLIEDVALPAPPAPTPLPTLTPFPTLPPIPVPSATRPKP